MKALGRFIIRIKRSIMDQCETCGHKLHVWSDRNSYCDNCKKRV